MTAVDPGAPAAPAAGGPAAAHFTDWRRLEPGQSCQLRIFDTDDGSDTLVHETRDAVIEAPNWSPDGAWLVVNCDGLLYRLPATGGPLTQIVSTGLADSNNDHVLSPDGRLVYSSSKNGHLYAIDFDGGVARRVTRDGDGLKKRYLHGISPDGARLALVGLQVVDGVACFNLFIASVADGSLHQLTTGSAPHDGIEYSPDGRYLLFNSERASSIAGHSQLFRMAVDGSGVEQLTRDDRVNWFPHVSPDGLRMLYLSYAPGTTQHPPNRHVELRLATPEGGDPRVLVSLFGGQGTVNVNSWAPDSHRFAYISYPLDSAD